MEDDVKKLGTLIEALTHSGSQNLDEDIFKEVKKICKSSQNYIPHAYKFIFGQLRKKNSQIRLTAFQICKELFKRSHAFRELVEKDLNLIFELTAGINTKNKLPPPNSSAENLKNVALSTLKTWVEEFGEAHPKLKIAYNYLKKCKQVNFELFENGSPGEQTVENEQQRQLRIVNEEKLKKILDEFESNKPEILTTVTSLLNCLSLLLPPAEDFFIPDHAIKEVNLGESDNSKDDISNDVKKQRQSKEDEGEEGEEEEEEESCVLAHKHNLREFGVPLNYNLTIKLNTNDNIRIEKTEENGAILENAKDCVRLINNRFLPMVKKWIKIYCKHSERCSSNIKTIIDVKEQLDSVLKKYNLLTIEGDSGLLDDSSSDDDDFEEVKKEGYEDGVDLIEDLDSVKGLTHLNKQDAKSSNTQSTQPGNSEKDYGDCTPSTSKESTSGNQDSDRKSKLLAVAPKVPFDIDLYHWEDEDLKAPTLISTKIDVDKFWGSSGSDDIHEIPNPDGLAALRTRVIEFTGKFEPVKWSCRAPLPNGKLCPRKDRYKCPFHGKIVARNELGNIQNKEEEKILVQTAGESSTSEWQDPELLNEIEAATGINLRMPDAKGKKRKSEKNNLTHKKMKTSAEALKILKGKNLPGLDDVIRRQNNCYKRLSKKLFNRSAVKRVSSVLNKIDRNKFQDKFGDQFNYF